MKKIKEFVNEMVKETIEFYAALSTRGVYLR